MGDIHEPKFVGSAHYSLSLSILPSEPQLPVEDSKLYFWSYTYYPSCLWKKEIRMAHNKSLENKLLWIKIWCGPLSSSKFKIHVFQHVMTRLESVLRI